MNRDQILIEQAEMRAQETVCLGIADTQRYRNEALRRFKCGEGCLRCGADGNSIHKHESQMFEHYFCSGCGYSPIFRK